jgi:hypothetical protein
MLPFREEKKKESSFSHGKILCDFFSGFYFLFFWISEVSSKGRGVLEIRTSNLYFMSCDF